MKKILLLCLLLTGCVSDGNLTSVCTKVEVANELTTTTTYYIDFEVDKIKKVTIIEDHIADYDTIEAIRLTHTTQHNFWTNLTINILVDEDNHYKVEYQINPNDVDENIYNHFHLKKERSKLVTDLKEEDFTCE